MENFGTFKRDYSTEKETKQRKETTGEREREKRHARQGDCLLINVRLVDWFFSPDTCWTISPSVSFYKRIGLKESCAETHSVTGTLSFSFWILHQLWTWTVLTFKLTPALATVFLDISHFFSARKQAGPERASENECISIDGLNPCVASDSDLVSNIP